MNEETMHFCPNCGTLNDNPEYYAVLSDELKNHKQRSSPEWGTPLMDTDYETYECVAKYKCKHCHAVVDTNYSIYRIVGAKIGVDTGQKKPYFKDDREQRLKGEIEQEIQKFHQRMERAEKSGQKRRKALMEAEEIAYRIMRLDRHRFDNFGGEPSGKHDRLVKIPHDMLNPPDNDEDESCSCDCEDT